MSFPASNLALTKIQLIPRHLSFRWFTKHHIAFYFELLALTVIGLALTLSVEAAVDNTVVQPKIASTSPSNGYLAQDLANPISIEFTNPINQADIKITTQPNVGGEIKFIKGPLGENFVKKIVFQPRVTLKITTNYQVNITNIHSVAGLDTPYSYSFKFKTIELPKI